ncbi:hypothetical protein K5E26_10000 [Acinetobacter baumannii]|uniref:hypothetical protein n=1 Tax=Acinetobacter baumannii TaxID=470 RepID=UPI001FF62705|nr:hypothetical protein [Acinetobacter baumannii]MCJ9008438.1 hypothetical protein [Acinetobacter baumannii]
MSKTKVNPKWFRHEALHTSYVLLSMVNDHLTRHQYYLERINPEFNRHIDAEGVNVTQGNSINSLNSRVTNLENKVG